MARPDLQLTPLHEAAAGLFAALAIIVAAVGWWEALHLDVARSLTFARPGQPIESGWQPVGIGVASITIGGSVALGIVRHGFANKGERLFLSLLLIGMVGWTMFGAAAIYAGIETFRRSPTPVEVHSGAQLAAPTGLHIMTQM